MAQSILSQIASAPKSSANLGAAFLRGREFSQQSDVRKDQRNLLQEQAKGRKQETATAEATALDIEVAGDVLASFAAGAGPTQDSILQRALAKAPPGSSEQAGIKDLLDTPAGKDRDSKLIRLTNAFQQRGLLKAPVAAPKASKTADQIERELKVSEGKLSVEEEKLKNIPPRKTADQIEREVKVSEDAQRTRESELLERQAETKRKAGELKPTMQKILDSAQTIAFESEKTANGFDLLSKDFDSLGFSGGAKASIGDFLKDTLGSQDEISELRRKFRGIRASQATKNLPPGPASDKDIALALSGFPPENAPARVISSFIKGAAKIARIDQAFQTFKAEFVSDNKNTAGMLQSWRENRTDIINDAIKDFTSTEAVQDQVIMRHQSLGDITESDIQETMSKNSLSREQVLQRLGGQ